MFYFNIPLESSAPLAVLEVMMATAGTICLTLAVLDISLRAVRARRVHGLRPVGAHATFAPDIPKGRKPHAAKSWRS